MADPKSIKRKPLTAEHRAKLSAALTGRVRSPEHSRRLSAALKGREHSEETRAKIAATLTGKRASLETRAKLSAAQMGHVISAETRAKIGAANAGRVRTPEARARISATLTGRPGPRRSPETRAKMSAAQKGRRNSPELRKKLLAAHLGKKQSPAWIAKRAASLIRSGKRRSTATPEERSRKAVAKMRAWAKAHPERYRELMRKGGMVRRARKLGAFVEVVDPLVVYARDRGICGVCSHEIATGGKWDIDHVVPLAKGGVHAYHNVQLAHASCNRKKGAKLLPERKAS